MAHFVMLSKVECQWCEKAKKIINDAFPESTLVEIKVENPSPLRDFMLTMGWRTVPQVWWIDEDGPSHIGGYDEVRDAYSEEGTGASIV